MSKTTGATFIKRVWKMLLIAEPLFTPPSIDQLPLPNKVRTDVACSPVENTEHLPRLPLCVESQRQIEQMVETHGGHLPVRVLHDRCPLRA